MFFERKFEFTPDNANTVNSIVYIISAVASPVLGLLVDKVGKNVFWVCLSVLVSIGCHALLAFTFINPYVAMVSITIFHYCHLFSSIDLGIELKFWTVHESRSKAQNKVSILEPYFSIDVTTYFI